MLHRVVANCACLRGGVIGAPVYRPKFGRLRVCWNSLITMWAVRRTARIAVLLAAAAIPAAAQSPDPAPQPPPVAGSSTAADDDIVVVTASRREEQLLN